MTTNDRRLVAVFAAVHTMVHIFEQALPALFPLLMAHFALSVSAAGNVQFGLALAFGVWAVPAGLLAARWGAHRVVQLYLVIASAGALVMAWAPNTAVLTCGAILVGTGIGLYHPAGTSFLATHVRARSKAMGYHGMGGGLGVSSGPVLTVALAAVLGWSATLVVYAGVGLVLIYLVRHVPGMMNGAPETDTADTPHPTAPPPEGTNDPRRLGILLVSATMVGFVYRGVITFLPLYLGLALAGPDNPERVALLGGIFASGALYIGMGAQWLGGQLGERYSPTGLFALGHTLSVPCLVLLAYADGYALVPVAAMFAFGHFLAQPVGNVLVANYTSAGKRERAFGWYFALAFGVGAFAATIGGRIGQEFTLASIFLLLAGAASVAVVAAWWLHFMPGPAPTAARQPAEA